MSETITKQVQHLLPGDHIVADLAEPNMVIMVETEDGQIVITTQAGVFTKEPEFEVNVREATPFERTAWKCINDFWGSKEGDNRKFQKRALFDFIMHVKGQADLAAE